MRNAEITQTITNYLAKNFEDLPEAMPDEKYFFVQGASTGERFYAKPRIVMGTAIDILADTIEKDQFFGGYTPREVSQANNSGNAKIRILKDGKEVHGNFEVKLLDNGLFIAAEEVGKKSYLDILRTAEGFKQAAELLGIEENLEKVVETIYQG